MATLGWIKIHREIREHWLAQDMEKLGRWIDLLLLANFEDGKVLSGDTLVELKRGQLVASLEFLAKRWNTSKRTVLRFLQLLESDQMLHRSAHRKVTILTICNYDSYQVSEKQEVTDSCTDRYPIGNRLVTEEKKKQEEKEINNTNTAHAREGVISWDASQEQQFFNTFKGQGSAIPLAKKIGKTPQGVMKLLDVYMAHRELKNKGHKDFQEFVNLFIWHIENNKISIPVVKKEPKVISGAAIFDVYGKQ